MIIAHLADLHLGYRAYHRLAPDARAGPEGRGALPANARERDVCNAFAVAVDRIIERRADLVVVAGDVFHTVRPSNGAIAFAFRHFSRLADVLSAPIVIVAGNHDSPRAAETGSILALLAEIAGIHVIDREPARVRLPELDACVLGVPHGPLASGVTVDLAPDADAATNILVMHGTLRGNGVDDLLGWVSEYGGADVWLDDLALDRWDYVALGHYHVATQVAPHAWYAGAIERTSTNIWIETGPKGFVTFDTATRSASFEPLPTRDVIDTRMSARDPESDGFLDPKSVDARIRELVDGIPGGIDGRIIRLIIEDIPRELFRDLDHRRLRDYRARALHFHLDARRPERRRPDPDGPQRARPIEDEVVSFLSSEWRPTSRDIDTARLRDLALLYLAQAATSEADPLLDAGDAEPAAP